MKTPLPSLSIDQIRSEIIGFNYSFETPFGKRLMLYADYTASGRGLRLIEDYLVSIQESYANTHTEDDVTGRSTTLMLHKALDIIKKAMGADEQVAVIAAGTGSTGAIQRFQQILGVYVPPTTRQHLQDELEAANPGKGEAVWNDMMKNRPVVFVGPFEHHSNEITWRECLVETVSVNLGTDGNIDLKDLEAKVSDPKWGSRKKIGAFSACSNVTGIKARVEEIAKILHQHNALACFDFAASAPYVEVDMCKKDGAHLDAVFLSPHKFLGGPGSSGLLLFRRDIYRSDLPPTCGAGGTVDYVSPTGHDYIQDIEERETPGTPGTLQVMKAALAIQLKSVIGVEAIQKQEHHLFSRALDRLKKVPGVEMLGAPDPGSHIGILSFSIRHKDRYLHPKLVTRLLNDLFGIQSRAGCSCAGPYGHALLNIGPEVSGAYRDQILKGCSGVKPGWIRVGFHYSFNEAEVDYICDALDFIARKGHQFISAYTLNLKSGAWEHEADKRLNGCSFGLDCAKKVRDSGTTDDPSVDRAGEFKRALAEAERLATRQSSNDFVQLPTELEKLSYFYVQKFV